MKTSKENKILVLEKAIENIKNDKWYRDGIQFYSIAMGVYVDAAPDDRPFLFNFAGHRFRVKPETITINGVEIPMPLSMSEVKGIPLDRELYSPWSDGSLYWGRSAESFCQTMGSKTLIYKTKEQAIEASKLLFGIED